MNTVYADLDLSSIPPIVGGTSAPFMAIGLVTSEFVAKPALAAWDTLRARALV